MSGGICGTIFGNLVSRVKLDEWHSSGRPPPAALFEKDGMSSLIKRGRESIK